MSPNLGYISNKTTILAVFSILACIFTALLLQKSGFSGNHIVLLELLLAATLCWGFNILSFHVVSLALPVAAVILGATEPEQAFSGFTNPSWFLVLAVFAIAAAISKTGLLYRLALLTVKRFPPSYIGQTFALSLTGLILTPVIPSANGRAALVSPLALNLSEALGFKDNSPGSIGIGMSCLLGFGHMSFMFMNGTATCLLVLGLLPQETTSGITWAYWLVAALPLGIFFFILSYFSILLIYRPKEKISLNLSVIETQLKTLGPVTREEIVSIATILVCLAGFLTEPWHHINGSWIALVAFLILFGSSVLDEKSVRADIDWNFLISFGALVGFGVVMTTSGLTGEIAERISPVLEFISVNKLLFLLFISLGVYLLRFFLPLAPAQLITMLSIIPVATSAGINPFVIGLVVLVSSNPWFLPYQNTMYLNLFYGTEEKSFQHRQTLKQAYLHVLITLVSIALAVPYWYQLGLIS